MDGGGRGGAGSGDYGGIRGRVEGEAGDGQDGHGRWQPRRARWPNEQQAWCRHASPSTPQGSSAPSSRLIDEDSPPRLDRELIGTHAGAASRSRKRRDHLSLAARPALSGRAASSRAPALPLPAWTCSSTIGVSVSAAPSAPAFVRPWSPCRCAAACRRTRPSPFLPRPRACGRRAQPEGTCRGPLDLAPGSGSRSSVSMCPPWAYEDIMLIRRYHLRTGSTLSLAWLLGNRRRRTSPLGSASRPLWIGPRSGL